MAYLTVDGKRRVYFEDHGSGDCALVLIHGWGLDGRVWDGVLMPLLADARRVIVMDHRGCGGSDHDFPDLGIAAIAGDVARLVREAGVSKAVLNGWSLGGAVATRAAHELGATCAGLVLTAGASPIYTQKPDLAPGGTAEDVLATVAAIDADRISVLRGVADAVCAKPVSAHVTEWMALSFINSSARATATLAELACEEGIEIIRRAWRGEAVNFEGKRFEVGDLRITPAPEHPPKILLGGMAPPAIDRVARIADGFLCTGGLGLDSYREALERHGKSVSDGEVIPGCWAIIAADPEREAHRVGEHVLYQANEYIRWGAFGPPERNPTFSSPSEAIENGLYEPRDADTAVARLSRLLADYPMISDIHFWAQFPGEAVESGNRRLRYIAENVLPRLRAA